MKKPDSLIFRDSATSLGQMSIGGLLVFLQDLQEKKEYYGEDTKIYLESPYKMEIFENVQILYGKIKERLKSLVEEKEFYRVPAFYHTQSNGERILISEMDTRDLISVVAMIDRVANGTIFTQFKLEGLSDKYFEGPAFEKEEVFKYFGYKKYLRELKKRARKTLKEWDFN